MRQASRSCSTIATPTFSRHATLVAGVMVAAANGAGAVGVANNATLAGYCLPNAFPVTAASRLGNDGQRRRGLGWHETDASACGSARF